MDGDINVSIVISAEATGNVDPVGSETSPILVTMAATGHHLFGQINSTLVVGLNHFTGSIDKPITILPSGLGWNLVEGQATSPVDLVIEYTAGWSTVVADANPEIKITARAIGINNGGVGGAVASKLVINPSITGHSTSSLGRVSRPVDLRMGALGSVNDGVGAIAPLLPVRVSMAASGSRFLSSDRIANVGKTIKITPSLQGVVGDGTRHDQAGMIGKAIVISGVLSGTATYPPIMINVPVTARGDYFHNYTELAILPVNISPHITGQYGQSHSGSLSRSVVISATLLGNQDAQGVIAKQITITPSITATVDNSGVSAIYSQVRINASARAFYGTMAGSIAKTFAPTLVALGGTSTKYGSISKPLPIAISAQGKAIPSGRITGTVVVSSHFTHYANSDRLGEIHKVEVPIVPTILGGHPAGNLYAYLHNSELLITTDEMTTRGYVGGRAGTIAATINIKAYLAEELFGIAAAKINPYAVASVTPLEGMTVPKFNVQSIVMDPPASLAVAKTIVYAVIAPAEEEQLDSYEAVLFF